MTEEERALIRETVRDVVREEVPVLIERRVCLVEEAGICLDAHKTHHKLIAKLLDDLGSTRKAFLAGVVVTVTGGVLGLMWVFMRSRLKEVFPWLP